MSSNVEKIKERLSIVDVLGNYIKLEKAGSNFKAKCPFHNEKTPSFFVSPARESYYCFGCGAKGDIFNFVQDFEGLDFMGALKALALQAGVEVDVQSNESKTEKERLLELLEIATLFFEENLDKNKPALEYLKNRGLKEETIKSWRLGYAEDDWRKLLNFAKQKGFKEEDLYKAGLIKKSPEKGDWYDVFRGRIIFPIFDSVSRPVAFSGRILVEKENAPKYLNSPETILFNKSEVLYGFDRAKSAIRRKNYSVLVEGQMDLVMSHQADFQNTVASSGTAFSLEQLSRLKRLSERIILAYDGDSAGFRAAERSARLGLSLGMSVKVAPLPQGEDPASIIQKKPDSWMEILKKSVHIIDFYLDKILSSQQPQRKIDQDIKLKILPLIKLLPSQIDQSRFVAEVAEKSRIKEDAMWDDLKKLPVDKEIRHEGVGAEWVKEQLTENRKSNIMSKIAGIIFWQETLPNSQIETETITERLLELDGEEVKFLEKFESRKGELIFESEAYFGGKENLSDITQDLILNLEEEILKEKFEEAMRQLHEAERNKDKENTEKILTECRDLGQKINSLKVKRAGNV